MREVLTTYVCARAWLRISRHLASGIVVLCLLDELPVVSFTICFSQALLPVLRVKTAIYNIGPEARQIYVKLIYD